MPRPSVGGPGSNQARDDNDETDNDTPEHETSLGGQHKQHDAYECDARASRYQDRLRSHPCVHNRERRDPITDVIVGRAERTQYSRGACDWTRSRGVLDTPHARGMTVRRAGYDGQVRGGTSRAPHPFFFTSLILENVMPSARFLV